MARQPQLSVSPPPTWSWMAYEGAIMYTDAPFGKVEWEEKDVRSPWSSSDLGTWSHSGDKSYDTSGLTVVARAFDTQAAEASKGASIILDAPIPKDELGPSLRCVVLGRSKSLGKSPNIGMYFVLLVTAEASKSPPVMGPEGSQIFRRMGIGRIPGDCILLDEPALSGQVR